MRYKAVIFDLFGTLVCPFEPSAFQRSLEEMAEAVGVGDDAFRQSWTRDTWQERATGRFPTIEANVEHICGVSGVSASPQQLAQAARIRCAFTQSVLRPRDDAVSTLEALRGKGLLLGLVSDCSAEVPRLWPETLFAPLIDVPIFSCEVGTRKPDGRIYEMACEGLGVAPPDCIYVGDGFSHELEGAAALGMCPVLIAPPNEEPPDKNNWEGNAWKGKRIIRLEEVLLLCH